MSEGFESVYVLAGGLEAWIEAGFETAAVDPKQQPADGLAGSFSDPSALALEANSQYTHSFLPGLVENYAKRFKLPVQRELSVLFVDLADSTSMVLDASPEETLAFVQRFMGIVTGVALSMCGDVKDYEGDGALLYFESVSEAVQAALEMREQLGNQTFEGGLRFRARFSLDVGQIVIGAIGTPLRRSVALIGPSINLAARLLKQIPPDGIIATQAIVDRLREEMPEIAERFEMLDEKLELKGFEQKSVTAYTVS